jgi:ABC-2 type transport system permease protein
MSFKNCLILIKSEIKNYIVSPSAYVFTIIFLIFTGFFTFNVSHFFSADETSLRSFFYWHPMLYLVLVPAVGMHLWADERKTGTIELLFTMPISVSEALISKFTAAWLVIAVALTMTFPMVVSVYILGTPDSGTIICGYFGSFLVAGTYLSIAGFTSSITNSQVVSFILSVVICLFLFLAGLPSVTDMLVNWAPVELIDTVASFSIVTHFRNMQRGIIELKDMVYFASMIFFFLFTTGLILKNNRGG